MRALESITGHVIYNPAYTYKFQLKTTLEMRELLVCGRVSKRICNLCHDRALWKNVRKSMEEKTNVWFPQNNGELIFKPNAT